MKRMPLERPTDHYDERLRSMDEQICALLKQRKDASDNNPGYPPFAYIARWAAEYELYEDYLKTLFAVLRNEELYKPIVEPAGFRTHIPVLKSVQNGMFFYTLTAIRQYANASVLTLAVDWDVTETSVSDKPPHFELSVGDAYECRFESGGSTAGHSAANYVVSPPLPDNLSGMAFVFKGHARPFMQQPTGVEVIIRVD